MDIHENRRQRGLFFVTAVVRALRRTRKRQKNSAASIEAALVTIIMVGVARLELAASCSRSKHSTT